MVRITKSGKIDKRSNSSASNAKKARDKLLGYIKAGKLANESDESESDEPELEPELEPEPIEQEIEEESEESEESEEESTEEEESEEEPEPEPVVKPKRKKKKNKEVELMKEEMAMMREQFSQFNKPQPPQQSYYQKQQAKQFEIQNKLSNAFLSQFN